jgi:hypothetical protein
MNIQKLYERPLGFVFLIGLSILITFLGFKAIEIVMYNYSLAKFHDVSYEYEKHGISWNGKPAWGNQGNILGLEATLVKDVYSCPNVESKRGNTTIDLVGEKVICCWDSNNNYQFLVPAKDVGEKRHFLCGKWPYLDEAIISKRFLKQD